MFSVEITTQKLNGYTQSPDCFFDIEDMADCKVLLMDYVAKQFHSDRHFVYETPGGYSGVVKLNDARIFTYMIFQD